MPSTKCALAKQMAESMGWSIPRWKAARSALVQAGVIKCLHPGGRGPNDPPIYVWALLISLALNKVWRRHRLAVHGLDPNLVDVIKRQKQARMHEDYIRRFGPRPESAEWQSNSSPF